MCDIKLEAREYQCGKVKQTVEIGVEPCAFPDSTSHTPDQIVASEVTTQDRCPTNVGAPRVAPAVGMISVGLLAQSSHQGPDLNYHSFISRCQHSGGTMRYQI